MLRGRVARGPLLAALRNASMDCRAAGRAPLSSRVILLALGCIAALLGAWRLSSTLWTVARDRAVPFFPQRPIHVVLRTSGRTQTLNGGIRPPWFSKELVFANLRATVDNASSVHVLFDGDSPPPYLTRAAPRVTVERFRGGSGDASFQYQVEFALAQGWPADDILYLLEDDYLHAPGWPRVLREGISVADAAYVTLYDHMDRYDPPGGTGSYLSRVIVTASAHWRTAPSTTNTFATLVGTLRRDLLLQLAHGNADHEKFVALAAQGSGLVSSIPGYSTHCILVLGSPVVDWERIAGATAVQRDARG
jgi:hypothetical protein